MSTVDFPGRKPPTEDLRAPQSPDAQWQQLWFSAFRQPRSSVAIIPLEAGQDANQVAQALVAVGQQLSGSAVRFIDAVGAGLGDVQALVDETREMTNRGDSVVVAVDPIAQNPAAIPIVLATSGALLVVRIGASHFAQAQKTIETIGRDRLLGSVILG